MMCETIFGLDRRKQRNRRTDARARMIRLQSKAAMATQPVSDLSSLIIEPVPSLPALVSDRLRSRKTLNS
jgi:hypothetical protein